MTRGKDARVCVIGAGPSGITAAKHLLQVGIKHVVVYDRNSEVGGNWVYSDTVGHSSVYETAHIISSKTFSQYHDFPMPADYPDYPAHPLLKAYFQSYADHFGVTDHIQFNTSVQRALKNEDGSWTLTLDSGDVERFDYLMVANGHHWDPRYPDYPGEFTGEMMHSHFYRTHLPFRGKRVLIIGGGNSACDIAVDISRHAAVTALSWRRGYYVIPKLLFGQPPDVIDARVQFLPAGIRRRLFYLLWRLVVGRNEMYGLPEPDHNVTESHPILNSQLLYQLRHGEIIPRPDVNCFEGKRVHFSDGTAEEYDVVITGTGYKISFPFFDEAFINFTEGDVPLYLRAFHPDHPTMAFIGLVQPQGCIWPLADTQSQIYANYIVGRYDFPPNIRERVRREVAHINTYFLKSPRHTLEVDYHDYLARLQRELPADAPDWGAVSA